MKTLERKTVEQPQKQMATVATGQFATVEALATYKTTQANKMLAKVKNFDEFFTVDGMRK